MSFFNAYQLLTEVAREHHHQRETFSTAEITARINEIKYLSAQKKVPKLSLRKEIIHLENKLATVVEIEQRMVKHKKQDSAREKSMKRQIKELQSRLAAAGDKEVQKKLDQVTHLLGDYLAQKATEEDVKAVIAEIELGKKREKVSPVAVTLTKAVPPPAPAEDVRPRIQELQQRLEMLKSELELLRILKKDSRAQGVAEKIAMIEQRLKAYALSGIAAIPPVEKTETPLPAAPVVEKKEIKHTMLFAPPAAKTEEEVKAEAPSQKITDEDLELEKELPLPPPPKMRK